VVLQRDPFLNSTQVSYFPSTATPLPGLPHKKANSTSSSRNFHSSSSLSVYFEHGKSHRWYDLDPCEADSGVVGGGLSGLSAAHSVLQAGGNVLVLDKNPFFGMFHSFHDSISNTF
jgi:FAD binding domain